MSRPGRRAAVLEDTWYNQNHVLIYFEIQRDMILLSPHRTLALSAIIRPDFSSVEKFCQRFKPARMRFKDAIAEITPEIRHNLNRRLMQFLIKKSEVVKRDGRLPRCQCPRCEHADNFYEEILATAYLDQPFWGERFIKSLPSLKTVPVPENLKDLVEEIRIKETPIKTPIKLERPNRVEVYSGVNIDLNFIDEIKLNLQGNAIPPTEPEVAETLKRKADYEEGEKPEVPEKLAKMDEFEAVTTANGGKKAEVDTTA